MKLASMGGHQVVSLRDKKIKRKKINAPPSETEEAVEAPVSSNQGEALNEADPRELKEGVLRLKDFLKRKTKKSGKNSQGFQSLGGEPEKQNSKMQRALKTYQALSQNDTEGDCPEQKGVYLRKLY